MVPPRGGARVGGKTPSVLAIRRGVRRCGGAQIGAPIGNNSAAAGGIRSKHDDLSRMPADNSLRYMSFFGNGNGEFAASDDAAWLSMVHANMFTSG